MCTWGKKFDVFQCTFQLFSVAVVHDMGSIPNKVAGYQVYFYHPSGCRESNMELQMTSQPQSHSENHSGNANSIWKSARVLLGVSPPKRKPTQLEISSSDSNTLTHSTTFLEWDLSFSILRKQT